MFFLAIFTPSWASEDSKYVDLFTGNSQYSLPLDLPPGTNGLNPTLSLNYNSDAGNSWIGEGWGLSGLGYIERQGPQGGLAPSFTEEDTYYINMPLASDRLIKTGVDPTRNKGNYYHTRREKFLRIEKFDDLDYWVVTDRSGTKYYFGRTSDARQGGDIIVSYTLPVVRWYLHRVEDVRGLSWTVRYDRDNWTSFIYPKKIVYTQGLDLACNESNLSACRTIDFVTGPRSDVKTSFTSGRTIVENKLLKKIEIRIGGKLTKTYSLRHQINLPGAAHFAGVSQLSNVTEGGADGLVAIPSYKSSLSSKNARHTFFSYNVGDTPIDFKKEKILNSPNTLILHPCVSVIDLNRDGLDDVFFGGGPTWNTSQFYHLNKKSFGEQRAFESAVSVQQPSTPIPELCSVRLEKRRFYIAKGGVSFNIGMDFSFGENSGGLLSLSGSKAFYKGFDRSVLVPVSDRVIVDLDGDGYPDIVDGKIAGQWKWWKNTTGGQEGRGVAPVSFGEPTPVVNAPAVSLDDTNGSGTDSLRGVQFLDFDGNGLYDVIQIDKDRVESGSDRPLVWNFKIWKNKGNGVFSATPIEIKDIEVWRTEPANSPYASNLSPLSPSGIRFIDLNGDNLPDFVTLAQFSNGTGFAIYYYPNLGGRTFSSRTRMLRLGENPLVMPFRPTSNCGDFFDLNGDALPDYVCFASREKAPYYYPNLGNGMFGELIRIPGLEPVVAKLKYRRIANIDGDGFLDILISPDLRDYRWFSTDRKKNHRLLDKVTNLFGGEMTFDYGREYYPGGVKWVVDRLNTQQGLEYKLGKEWSTSVYTFHSGWRAPWPWQDFRGFSNSNVRILSPKNQELQFREFVFDQENGKKGLLKYTALRKGPSSLLSSSSSRSYNQVLSRGVYRVDIQEVVDLVLGTGFQTGTQTNYLDYDSYGQAQSKEVIGIGAASGPGPRRVLTKSEFLYNKVAYIVNKPSYVSKSVNKQITQQKWFDYDGQENGAIPSKGDLTREQTWFSQGSDRVLRFTYDLYGNKVGSIDAKVNLCSSTGLTTQLRFDALFQTYTVEEKNALCHQTTKTYWGINATLDAFRVSEAYPFPGRIATSTDQNGVTLETYWDVLGRSKARVEPPDTFAAPTQLTDYEYDGPFFSRILESARETPTGGTLDQVSELDGFGRPIKISREGENSGKGFAKNIGKWLNEIIRYDFFGRIESTSLQNNHEVRYQYDQSVQPSPFARTVITTNPDGSVRHTSKRGFTIIDTNEKGFSTTQKYDAWGRRLAVFEDPSAGGVTKYTYDDFDAEGNETRTVTDDQGNVTTKIFDTLGRLTIDIDPDLGERRFEYDPVGNLLRQVDAKGQTIDYTYDPLNRIKTKMFNVPSPPFNLQITGETATQIDLAWSPSEDAGGIASYRIERCENENCSNFSEIGISATLGLSDLNVVSESLYRYRVRAVGNDGDTGRYSNTVSAFASNSPPDLSIVSVISPSNAFTGSSILNLGATLSNIGGGSAGPAQLGLYLSSDNIITTSDFLLDDLSTEHLLPNKSRTERSVSGYYFPSNMAAGTYYIGAIADKNNEIAESNEANNTAANAISIVPGPDLEIVGLSGPTTAKTGTGMSTSITLKNQGQGRADRYYVGYYLSTDGTISGDDLFLSGGLVQTHASGETISASHTLGIPLDLVEGQYFLGAVVDYSNAVVEGNESNNTFISQTPVDIQPGDLNWLPAVLYLLLN